MWLFECIAETFNVSKKEAKRLIASGGIRINDVLVSSMDYKIGFLEDKIFVFRDIDGKRMIHEGCVK